MVFTQFGLRRTGTNVVRKILEDNFGQTVKPHIFSWKHEPPRKLILTGKQGIYPDDWKTFAKKAREQTLSVKGQMGEIGIIINFRNPYSWLYGMQKFRQDTDVYSEAERFLERYWRYNLLFWELLHNVPNTFFTTHTWLIESQKKVIKEIATAFNLGEDYEVIDNYIGPSGDSGRKFDREFYLKEKYLDEIPKEAKELVSTTRPPFASCNHQ